MHMDYKLLGQNIAKIRLENHLTQEQLAEKADVSTVFISQIETAARKPSLETVVNIADSLNTTIDVLLGNPSLDTQYGELSKLLEHKTSNELHFITNIVREICSNIKDDKIVLQDSHCE